MNKKGQEEIVGFVLIVVIVSVILLVFLGILIRQEPENERESREIYQFLESMMEYTSDCATNYEPDYSKLGELINKCNSGANLCANGKDPCEVADRTIRDIIDSSFSVSGEEFYKGYEFKSLYREDINAEPDEIISIMKGNCSGSFIGSEFLDYGFSGTIISSFKLCS